MKVWQLVGALCCCWILAQRHIKHVFYTDLLKIFSWKRHSMGEVPLKTEQSCQFQFIAFLKLKECICTGDWTKLDSPRLKSQRNLFWKHRKIYLEFSHLLNVSVSQSIWNACWNTRLKITVIAFIYIHHIIFKCDLLNYKFS